MADLIDTGDYPQIRAAIDTKLNDKTLPDSVIEMDIYLDAGERDVLSRVSLSDITGDASKEAYAKRAAIYFVAARLVWAVVQATSMTTQTRDLAITRRAWDPAEKEAELLAKAAKEMGYLEDSDDQTDPPSGTLIFGRIKGRRGA